MHLKRLTEGKSVLRTLIALAAVMAAVAVAGFAPAAHAEENLSGDTWTLTVYGTVDVNYSYQTNGAPLNGEFYTGMNYLINKQSTGPQSAISGNGMSQSKIAFKGEDKLSDDLSALFKAEIGFNPWSGELANAVGGEAENNGVPLGKQSSNADGSRAGQILNGEAYVGLGSKMAGTLSVGRQNSLLLDDVLKYDPLGGSYAFSVIGFSGTTAGGGRTEDTRLDAAAKYVLNMANYHVALMNQPQGSQGYGDATQADVGGDFGGLSIDVAYSMIHDAVVVGPYTPTCPNSNGAGASAYGSGCTTSTSFPNAGINVGKGTLPANALKATISDNETAAVELKYKFGSTTAYLGWENITFEKPHFLPQGPQVTIGGYPIVVANSTAAGSGGTSGATFPKPEVLQVTWFGAKMAASDKLDLMGAYYRYDQNNFSGADSKGNNSLSGCHNDSNGKCSGALEAASLVADYKFDKRFDVYGGAMYSAVEGGQANGFIKNNTVDPTVGLRYNF